MNDLLIKVSKRSRLIDLDHSTLGIVGENLQEKLIFTFQDEFVDGMARLEYELDGEKHYVLMEKVGQSYILPVQNVLLTKEGNIDLQLVITEDKTGTPVFKSEVFTLYCKKSIEAVGEAPSSYELWIEKANRILLEASRVNIDGKKTGNETIITITQRDGNKKSFPILDGQDGQQGPQGPVGPQGPQGPEGPQGPVGPTPDLSNYVQKPEFNESQAEQDDTIEGLQAELDRYKLLENALPHTENETASDYVTLENTAKSPMEVSLTPQTSQDGEPTPDNPQEINRTTGENQVKVVGKNICSGVSLGINPQNLLFYFDKKNISRQFTLSFTSNIVLNDNSIYLLINGSSIGRINTISTDTNMKAIASIYLSEENYNAIKESNEVYIQVYKSGATFVPPNDAQIENSSSVTSYTPYEETTYPISLGNKEMFNINGVYDGFVYDETEDKFYFRRWNRKLELPIADMNNSENYPGWKSIAQVKTDFPEGAIPLGRDYDYLCNIHKKSVYGIYIDNRNLSGNIYLNKDTFNLTQSQWKTNYPNLVVILIYNLKNYVDEEITDTTLFSQLRAIKNALSMQGATHIISTSSGTNLPFLIKARAVQTIERT